MVHHCYPDKCLNIGHGCVCTKCKLGYLFTVRKQREELDIGDVRSLYRRCEAEDACVVPHSCVSWFGSTCSVEASTKNSLTMP